MRKRLIFFLFFFVLIPLFGCEGTTTQNSVENEKAIYQLLTETEALSGMSSWSGKLITESGNLDLPTEYKGVQITYHSRNTDILSDEGVVTLPDTCWIQSKDQQGEEDFPNLNDNWPIVVDVVMIYENQTRTAKLMFLIAPAEGFTCDKYLGD